MPRAPRHWFRFYVEAMQDPKIRGLSPTHRWLWVAILGIARSSCITGHLLVAETMPYTDEQIADWAALKVREVQGGLRELEARGMISWSPDLECWFVTRWVERQYESDSSTVRTRRYRAKPKEPHSDDVGTSQERSGNGRSDVPEQNRAEQSRETPPVAPLRVARTHGTRIPDEFTVTPEMYAWARDRCPAVDVDLQTERFVNWAKSCGTNKAVKADWVRAWRNWLLGEQAKAPRQPTRAVL